MARPHRWNFVLRRPAGMSIFACALAALACGAATAVSGPSALGDERKTVESQRREFAISIDGTKRGSCTMQIRRYNDGTISMRSEAEIRINYLVYRYNYTSAGTEIWKNGRLLAMQNVADYDGTQYRVKAVSTGRGLRLSVGDTVSEAPADAWLSSYWQTPERLVSAELADRSTADPNSAGPQEQHGTRYVSIIDSDKGGRLQGSLVRVGDEALSVAGEQKVCTHYRLSGDTKIELWYDASGRLVRQDSTERRHKVRFDLTEIAAE